MRITHIRSEGLKGRAISVALDDVSIIIGPNAAGKSAILDAILVAILGYRPGWGRTADSLLHAAERNEVWVEATVSGVEGEDEDVVVERSWERLYYKRGPKRGEFKKVEQKVRCSTVPEGSHQRKHEAEIRRMFGLSEEKAQRADQEQCLDVQSFLNLSHDKRRVALFRIAGELIAREWPPERLSKEAEKLGVSGYDGSDPMAWLERVWSESVANLSKVRSERREADAAVDGVEEERGEKTAPVDPAAVGRLKAQVSAAVDDEKKASAWWAGAVSASEAKLRSAAEHNADVEVARKKVVEIRERLSSIRKDDIETDPVLKAIQAEIDAIEAPWGTNSLSSIRQAAESARAQAEKPIDTSELDTADELVAQLELVVENARADLGSLRADAERARAVSESIIKLERSDNGECPLCRQPVGRSTLGALRDALAPLNASVDRAVEVESKIRDREAHLGQARDMRAVIQQRITDRKAEENRLYREAVDQVRSVESRLIDLRHQLSMAHQGGDNAEMVGRLSESLATWEGVANQEEESLDNLRKELERVSATAKAKSEELANATRLARDKFDVANRLLESYRVSMSLRARAAELRAAEKEASRLVSALGPRGLLGRVSATVLDPFKSAVNGLLEEARLGRFDVEVFDEDRNRTVLRMGLVREGSSMAPVETLSGGESTAVKAGISLGLATVSEMPWRPVLVDEVEGVDDARQSDLLEQVSSAVESGSASQALIMGCWWNGGGQMTGARHVDERKQIGEKS